ncbi:MAG: peptide chain release factor N(5)-glutamine methyltransferase [Gammaproteobacteria bacterium]|nr:peptide chain release factor N(5)-glutamine methyltransferase [Gammaproteobacteria bacterium]
MGAASDTPDLDARLLLQTLLKKDRAWLTAHGDDQVDDDTAGRYHAWVKRRAKSEPVAYIIERKAFWTHELKITRDVLVPRPETEILVERALARIPITEAVQVADLGTGSGAIALSLAEERPLCHVTATDSSGAALKLAEQNKAKTGLRNISFKQGHWHEPLGTDKFTVIVCNPPYVPHSHYEAALTYEPDQALFAGPHGLDELKTIIHHAPNHLEPNGWLLVEHGHDQATQVQAMFQKAGFKDIQTTNDYAGHPRTTEGRNPGNR